MKKGENYNRPGRGSQIKVEPIRDLKAIQAIKYLLKDKPRDLALFTLGINTALRASDLLQIRVGQVRDVKAGEDLEIRERKTGKPKRITLNKAAVDAIQAYLKVMPKDDHSFLFTGQRGPLTVPYVNSLVKQWCRAVKLKGNYGSHTLRKTFGYHQRKTFCVSLPILVDVFNHSSQKQTMEYLCIQPEEIRDVYLNEL
jgi:integrase